MGSGVFLLCIGIIWLMVNFGALESFSVLGSIIALWPLILVVVGVNVIFKPYSLVKAGTWLLFFAAIVSYGLYIDKSYTGDGKGNAVFTEKISSETKSGKIKIGMGATKVSLDSKTENLFDAGTVKPVDYKMSYSKGKEEAKVKIVRDNYLPFNFKGNSRLSDFHLNENVDWDIEVDTGAASGTLDMKNLKVNKFSLNMGFGSMNLNFGDRSKKMSVDIKMGFSSVNATVPKSCGVKIKMKDGLSGSNVKSLGWEKKDGYYVSPNYETAESKIHMEVEAGLSSFNMKIVD
jgi:hypothetical protein